MLLNIFLHNEKWMMTIDVISSNRLFYVKFITPDKVVNFRKLLISIRLRLTKFQHRQHQGTLWRHTILRQFHSLQSLQPTSLRHLTTLLAVSSSYSVCILVFPMRSKCPVATLNELWKLLFSESFWYNRLLLSVLCSVLYSHSFVRIV
jgi:hypothetical protein